MPVPQTIERRALLAGLLDTDGTVTANGNVQFSTTSKALADGAETATRVPAPKIASVFASGSASASGVARAE